MPREITNDDLADEWADRQASNAGNCKCRGDMPGSCPGPHNCPMCQPNEDEAEVVATDLATCTNPTQKRLRELFDYDPESGYFFRRTNYVARYSIGDKVCGTRNGCGYLVLKVDGSLYAYHRLIWVYVTGDKPVEIDHKNRNKCDNRWCNLRDATRSQNQQNTKVRVDNTSGIKGAFFDKRRGTWYAGITVNGKRKNLGAFSTPEAAGDAYAKAEAHFYPMSEQEAIASDIAYNASKATFHERNDALALQDQIMMRHLLREVS